MAANPMISNGTCYWAPDQKTDPIFIPCGNDAFGHKTCCQAGDKCVSSSACYNDLYGVTYLVGCSDPDYVDDSCPEKPGLADMTWVGLVTCAGSNLWSPCSEDGNPSTITSPDPCTCDTQSPVVAFTDATSLTDHARLPTALGESVVWAPGFLPTSPISASGSPSTETFTSPPSIFFSVVGPPMTAAPPSSLVPSPSSAASTTPPSSAAPAAQAQVSGNPTGMSTGAKAGIGAGVTVAVLAVLAGIATLLFVWRRRTKKRTTARGADRGGGTATAQDHPPTTEAKDAWSPSTVATTAAVSELDSGAAAARPWSVRSELQGSYYEDSPGPMGAVFWQNEPRGGGDRGSGHAAAMQAHQAQGLGVFVELQG